MVTSRKLTPEENDELKHQCGQRSLPEAPRPRLFSVGGWRAKNLEFPYIVGFTSTSDFCTGVQISKRHILTAAHCVMNLNGGGKWTIKPANEFTVYVGNKCGHPLLCSEEQSTYKALGNPVPYKGFNGFHGDIAVIELDRDIAKSQGLPVCMPERNESLGTHLTAVGYGWNPYEDNPIDDKPFYRLRAVELKLSHIVVNESEIVTLNRDQSICTGDSGGPLIQINKELKDVVVGISSKSYGCKDRYRELPSVFTDVRKKLDWICDRTGVCSTEE